MNVNPVNNSVNFQARFDVLDDAKILKPYQAKLLDKVSDRFEKHTSQYSDEDDAIRIITNRDGTARFDSIIGHGTIFGNLTQKGLQKFLEMSDEAELRVMKKYADAGNFVSKLYDKANKFLCEINQAVYKEFDGKHDMMVYSDYMNEIVHDAAKNQLKNNKFLGNPEYFNVDYLF